MRLHPQEVWPSVSADDKYLLSESSVTRAPSQRWQDSLIHSSAHSNTRIRNILVWTLYLYTRSAHTNRLRAISEPNREAICFSIDLLCFRLITVILYSSPGDSHPERWLHVSVRAISHSGMTKRTCFAYLCTSICILKHYYNLKIGLLAMLRDIWEYLCIRKATFNAWIVWIGTEVVNLSLHVSLRFFVILKLKECTQVFWQNERVTWHLQARRMGSRWGVLHSFLCSFEKYFMPCFPMPVMHTRLQTEFFVMLCCVDISINIISFCKACSMNQYV